MRKIRVRKLKGEESPYSHPAISQLREKLREAVPLLEFTSDTPKGVDERLKALEAFKTSLTPEQQEQARRGGLMFHKDVSEPKHRKGECKDGKHFAEEFKQVKEGALLRYLQEGWEIKHELPNGEVIIYKQD